MNDLPRYQLCADGQIPKHFDDKDDAVSYGQSNYEAFDVIDLETDRQVYVEWPQPNWV